MSDPEISKCGVHLCNNRNREEIIKLLTFLLLQGIHQKPDKKGYFPGEK
jgi:hypothetical protein